MARCVTLFLLAHSVSVMWEAAAESLHHCQESSASCSERRILPEHGSALLQTQRHRVRIEENVNFETADESMLAADVTTAPLTKEGFDEVNAGCCQLVVDFWLRQFITSLGWEICNDGGLNGYIPFATCNPNMTYEEVLTGLTQNLNSACPWIRPIGSTKDCLPYPAECPTGTFNPTWHRRRTCSSTTVPTEPPTEPPTERPTTEAPTELQTTEAPTEPPTTEASTEPPTTEAPTEPPTAPTEAPTEPPTTEAPTEPPTTEAPTEPPTEPPTQPPTTTKATTTTEAPTEAPTTTEEEAVTIECCTPVPVPEALLQTHARSRKVSSQKMQTHRSSSNLAAVQEFPCEEHSMPIQVLLRNGNDYYEVAELDLPTGEYKEVYRIPLSITTPAMEKELNSAGVNPMDGRAYATAKVDKTYYLIRHDKNGGLEFIAKLPSPTKFNKKAVGYNSAAFSMSGVYYMLTKGNVQHLIVIEGLNGYKGYTSQTDPDLTDLSNKLVGHALGATNWVADLAALPLDLDGSGQVEDYGFGLDGSSVMTIMKLVDPFPKWKVKAKGDGLIPARKNGFGAAWTYQERIFFASNVGRGVYEVDKTSIDLKALTMTMTYVGKSKATTKNDGMNCLAQKSPWPEQGECPENYLEVESTDKECAEGSFELQS